jgi:UDP-GlcNAc:undecaprenyl-phosphate/decaprenyl-phosphate GlcNAc-1-phosphate transferase
MGLKIHKRATPLMGGVAVFLAFALASVIALPISRPVLGLLIGGATAVLVGVIDEKYTLSPLVHLGGQVVAAMVAVVAGLGYIHSLSLPFRALTDPGYELPAVIGVALTVAWLVGMMNTVNFLDGLDGLVTGVSAEVCVLLAIWASGSSRYYIPVSAHHEDLLLPLALLGALLGFLPYNWHVASIFLGDSGAMFLGLALASLAIVGPTKLGTALMILIIPVLDVAWAIVRRSLRGRSFLTGDKQHVYHRMMNLGLSSTSTVLLLYALVALFGVLDWEFARVQKLVAFMVLAALTFACFVLLEARAERRLGRC